MNVYLVYLNEETAGFVDDAKTTTITMKLDKWKDDNMPTVLHVSWLG